MSAPPCQAAVGTLQRSRPIVYRTGQFDGPLREEVTLLWGGPHLQRAPEAWVARPSETVETSEERDADGRAVLRQDRKPSTAWVTAPLTRTDAHVTLDLEDRQKGLLWYDTYGVVFRATYVFTNPDAVDRRLRVRFAFPATHAMYDDFTFTINGAATPRQGDLTKEVESAVEVAGGGEVTLHVAYRSRGLDDWRYAFGGEGVAVARDFTLTQI